MLRSLYPVLRPLILLALDISTWGMHPSSPSMPAAVLRRHKIERLQ